MLDEYPSPESQFFRAKSPIMRQMDTESPLYDSAMSKLYDASWKFDRAKGGEFLKTLDNKMLTPENFRQILRAGMNCKLTPEELNALMPLFDNDGHVNGCEFILLFYRLRYDHRSKVLTSRVKKQKHTAESQKFKQKKKIEDLQQKAEIALVDYTQSDLDSAMQKIIDGAVKYDRLMPGAVQLDGFEVEFMQPHVFREQLKMVFNIQLNIPELSAFIKNFNKDNGHGDNVNCNAFLVTFFRAGFNEKTRRLHAYWAKEKRLREEREAKARQEKEEQDLKNSLKVAFDFEEEDKINAVRKLREAAKLYDKTTPGAMSMKAFEVKQMPPHIFKEQLRRIFNLQVNPKEMGALMHVFDVDGDGVITCEEFSKVFLKMGFEERTKALKDDLDRQKRIEEARERKRQEEEERLARKNAMKLSYSYTEEEWESAMEKLVEAAWGYDKTMPGAPCLDAFEKQYMEPHVFKEQMRRAFYMKLTPPELGAVMHYFDPDRTGRIHCESFLKKFVKMGFDERNRRMTVWREKEKAIADRKQREQRIKDKMADERVTMANMDMEYSEADFQSAFAKLTEGAIKYNRAGPGSVGLNAFEAESMPPHVFREQLKLVFNVKVSLPELWALVVYFDQKQTGVINCHHFLNQFLRTGYEERMRMQQGFRRERLAKQQKDVQKELDREAAKQKKAWAEVDFDYLEEDFDSALHKLVYLCHNFDRRQVGPAGLRAFQAESMNPAEFREQLKRTFNLKVTSRELGALVMYFDTAGKKVANCSAFLNALVQIRVSCEEYRGKKDESELIEEYIEMLKEQFRLRMERSMSVDARPWRQENTAPVHRKLLKGVPKKDGPAPTTPKEKYKLRVYIGRRTGRMDLACKLSWPPESVGDGASGGHSTAAAGMARNKSPPGKSGKEGVEAGGGRDIAKKEEKEEEEEEEEEELEQSFNLDAVDHKDVEDQQGGGDRDGNEDGNTDGIPSSDSIGEEEEIFGQVAARGEGDGEEQAVAKGGEPTVEPVLDFRLSVVPKEVLRLTELTELWLCNNLISVVPTAIGDLKQLTILSLSNNKIETLIPEICLLENMRRLYLRKNQLRSLPNLMGKMRKLVELDCAYNQFDVFPEVLTSLPQIEVIDFSSNRITTLPASMRSMTCLGFLNLEDNRLSPSSPPPPVLEKMPWLQVLGCPVSRAGGAREYLLRPDEEQELRALLKSRATGNAAAKMRRMKLRQGNLM